MGIRAAEAPVCLVFRLGWVGVRVKLKMCWSLARKGVKEKCVLRVRRPSGHRPPGTVPGSSVDNDPLVLPGGILGIAGAGGKQPRAQKKKEKQQK